MFDDGTDGICVATEGRLFRVGVVTLELVDGLLRDADHVSDLLLRETGVASKADEFGAEFPVFAGEDFGSCAREVKVRSRQVGVVKRGHVRNYNRTTWGLFKPLLRAPQSWSAFTVSVGGIFDIDLLCFVGRLDVLMEGDQLIGKLARFAVVKPELLRQSSVA